MMREQGRGLIIVLLVIFFLAFVVRLTPLVWSPYPYNIDGLGEARLAESIWDMGDLTMPEDVGYWNTYVPDMPSLNALIALASDMTGIHPLLLAQLLIAVVGALSCVFAAIVIHRISGSVRAGAFGGIFLALFGTFVFCTASVWKEALGLAMMIFIVGLFLERRDVRLRTIMTIALLLMTFIHHHSAVLTYLIITFAVAGDLYLTRRSNSWSWNSYADILTVIAIWAMASYYYRDVDLPYYHFLSPEQDLYLLIAISCIFFLLMVLVLSRQGAPSKRPYLKLVVPAVGVSLLAINYVRPIFPGIPGTEQALFLFATSYLVLLIPALFSADGMIGTREPWRAAVLALIIAPLTMILFAFIRALDVTSYTIAFRTFDFLDIGFAMLFGTGLVLLFKRFSRAKVIIAIPFMLLLLLTTPIAFQTEELFSVHNQTYEYEFDAFEAMHGISDDHSMNSDQRIGSTGKNLFNFSGGTDLALRIESGESIEDIHWVVVKSTWTTVGAQQFPFGQLVVTQEYLDDFLIEHDVLVIAGPVDNQIIGAIYSS